MRFEENKTDGRTRGFSRNRLLENILREVNSDLWVAEESILSSTAGTAASFPLIQIMGPMRSGTTLFMQWLANTGLVSYPTNLLSRFYQAPIIGAKIQLLLTDPRFKFRDELSGFSQQTEYSSDNGKTTGVLAPNEFWYFWRRFLENPSQDVWTDSELRKTFDINTMRAELIGMMDVFQKPFAAKGMLFNYNIPFLDVTFDKVIFVQMRRDIATNVESVLEARKRQLGDERSWYSFKIPEYESLRDLEPLDQAAGQVHFVNAAVTRGLHGVAEERKLVVDYEAFCENPAGIFDALVARLGADSPGYSGPDKFAVSRASNNATKAKIARALERFGN